MARHQLDTVRFDAPAARRRCAGEGGRGLLIEAIGEGNGVLVWLRTDGSAPAEGDYEILGVRDTVTPRGAIVSVRYMTGDVAHGFSLDSGLVNVAESGRTLRVRGAGLETVGAVRPFLAADFTGLALPAAGDSASCEPQR